MRRLDTLQHIHRLEEVGERFGVRLVRDAGAALRLPFAQLADVRVEGRRLDPAAIRERAARVGLRCDDVGIRLERGEEVAALEDALIAFFAPLVTASPRRFLGPPASGDLPESEAWLERLYRDAVQAALDEGLFDAHLVDAHAPIEPDTSLLGHVHGALQHLCYTNSAAEAVEKALHLARRFGGGGERVLTLDGPEAESASLAAVAAELEPGDVFAVIVDPGRFEGGDSGATNRFFNGLRRLVRAHRIALIFNEIQAGFGQGDSFFRHRRFWLTDAQGSPDGPDLVVCAGRAQAGVVLSRWPDAHPTAVHSASRLRGRIHRRIEPMAPVEVPRLEAAGSVPGGSGIPGIAAVLSGDDGASADRVLEAMGQLGEADRAAGLAFLDLSAGARGPALLDALRNADHAAFQGRTGVPFVQMAADLLGTRIRRVSDIGPRVEAVDYLRTVAEMDGGIMLVAEDPDGLVGTSFAGPLEHWWGVDGPRQDPNMGRGNTLYSADITVAARSRGRGIGYRLREEQLRQALAERRGAAPRYAFVVGRNRVGAADALWSINLELGAYVAAEYAGRGGDTAGRVRYYRIALRRWDRRAFEARDEAHPLLARARALGVFDEPALTRRATSGFITRPFARYAEAMRAIAPRGTRHLTLVSSPDEMADESIRVLRHRRPEGQVPVAIDGCWFGHTTAVARSLTSWDRFDEGCLGWPRVASVADLDALVARDGPERLLGVFVEALRTRTGEVMSPGLWAELCAFRDRTGVPIVLSETNTGGWRGGRGMWWLDRVVGDADMVLWWNGGQIGHVFCNDAMWVGDPGALVSTRDGDELSATRNLWQLWAAGEADVAATSKRLDEGLRSAGYDAAGTGLHRVLRVGEDEADRIADRLERVGLPALREGREQIVIRPPVWTDVREIDRTLQAIREARR